MADEARIQNSLFLKTGGLEYQSRPTAFTLDVSTGAGPTPGLINVSVSGTDLDLSQLTTPGLAVFQNLDLTNYVTLGPYEPDTDFFYPFIELPPAETNEGKPFVMLLSRFLKRELTGTGTLVGYNSTIRLVAKTATCKVKVEVFEK